MQRIMNNPDNIVDEMLKGFLKAHSDIVESTENGRVVKAKDIPEGKVGVVTGGGSGRSSGRRDLLFTDSSRIPGCMQSSRPGKRCCMLIRKLFRR